MNMFSKSKYYIKERLERYKNYYELTKLPIDEVISSVNCNVDYDYYTYDLKANIKDNTLILVNKYYKLDQDYVPDNLIYIDSNYSLRGCIKKEVNDKFKSMVFDALKNNLHLINASPYRSYKRQKEIYEKNKKTDKDVDLTNARPGYSEHQTGLALDIRNKEYDIDNFINTDEYLWVRDNAYKYGFILRYPKGMEKLTGYSFEPWHYRYVGYDVAKYIYDNNITFDEYYAYFIEKES